MNELIFKKVLTFLLLVLLSSLSALGQYDLFQSNDSGKWNSILMFNKTFGIHYPGWGLSYSGYHMDINKDKDWIFPWVVNIESYKLPPDPPEPNAGYFVDTKVNMKVGVGISAYKRLSKIFFMKFKFLIPLNLTSSDMETKKERGDYLLGVAMSQGLVFIPESSFGITFDVGIFERLLSSDVYKNDIGIQLEIGVKF